MLFEVRCPGCGALGWCPCPDCIDALELAPALETAHAPVLAGAASTTSLFSHSGVARSFVHALKFRRERSIARWLGEALAANAPVGITAVTWPPTTTARRRQRGFDQAELLARQLARRLAVPARKLLVRTSEVSQSGLDRVARLSGPAFATVGAGRASASERARAPASEHSAIQPSAVLVVDDVLTTGATLRAAVAALRAGAQAAGHPVVVHAASCTQAEHRAHQPSAKSLLGQTNPAVAFN